MSSIGPQLPPHLTKRKRTSEDEGSAPSPPAKKQLHDAADSDSSSDSDIGPTAAPILGPSAPPSVGPTIPSSIGPSASPPVGPSMPSPVGPPLPSQTYPRPKSPCRRPIAGPSLPPSTRPDSDSGSQDPATALPPAGPQKRTLGPSLPPSSSVPNPSPDSDSDSDSDSDYGPSLPSSTSHAHLAAKSSSIPLPSLPSNAPKRDDWMLAPPSASSSSRREVDPTRLRARKFASGPRANTSLPSSASGEISSLWTETAAEKAQRIADSVLGREPDPNTHSSSSKSTTLPGGVMLGVSGGSKKRTIEEEERIRSSIAAARGPSLMTSHRKANAKQIAEEEDKDDPSKRAFDREKDMAIGGRGLGGREKKEVFKQARDFGGRFSKGSFL